MKASQKKIVSALLICILLIGGAVIVSREAGVISKAQMTADTEQTATDKTQRAAEQDAAYEAAKTDLIFWYEDDTYAPFLEEAAKEYYLKTGVKVSPECRNTIDYIGDIYDKTMQDEAFPDVYLISGDNLEEAYLYGLVAVNESGTSKETSILPQAKEASAYQGKLLGYPLSYNTCVFVYQNGYFETVPTSLQAIIDYSDENEPAENVEYLLEWDVNDAFYDFPFVANSVSFEKYQSESMDVVYDEGLYQKDLEFFEAILESFSIDASKVSEEGIIENFLAGRTLCAIIDTDSLYRLEGYDYSLMQIPNLNEELVTETCAITDMLVVNDFSEKGEQAADFAEYVTIDMSGKLHEMTGHYSVIPSAEPDVTEQTAYQTYETAVPVPDSQDAKDFWVNLQETILKYF